MSIFRPLRTEILSARLQIQGPVHVKVVGRVGLEPTTKGL